MELNFFPHFVRGNFPSAANFSNEDLKEIGSDFKAYLLEIYIDDRDKLQKIWDINPASVVINQVQNTIGYVNGYHAAFVYHFTDFVEKMKKDIADENDVVGG